MRTQLYESPSLPPCACPADVRVCMERSPPVLSMSWVDAVAEFVSGAARVLKSCTCCSAAESALPSPQGRAQAATRVSRFSVSATLTVRACTRGCGVHDAGRQWGPGCAGAARGGPRHHAGTRIAGAATNSLCTTSPHIQNTTPSISPRYVNRSDAKGMRIWHA